MEYGSVAVEPLVAALKYSDGGVRVAAVVALVKLGDSRAVEPLLALLKDGKYHRETVAWALGELRDARAVEPLVEGLKDHDGSVRVAVAKALGELRDARAVEPLVEGLKDHDGSVRVAAAAALVRLEDSRAVEPLVAALNDRDDRVQLYAAWALGELRDARAIDPLVDALCYHGRTAALEALMKIGDPLALKLRVPAILTTNPHYFVTAVEALTTHRPRAIELVVAALKDNDQSVRRNAAKALSALAWKPESAEHGVALTIAEERFDSVVAYGSTAVEPLIRAVLDFDLSREALDKASEAIGKLARPQGIAVFVKALTDPEFQGRWRAAAALAKMGDENAVDALVTALRDGPINVTHEAAKALGRIGDTRAVRPLIEVAKNQSEISGDMINSLAILLEHKATGITTKDLQSVAALRPMTRTWTVDIGTCGFSIYRTESGQVDCSRVKQLARQELVRRGLGASPS